MSIECLNKALKIDGLTPTKKLVLVILANYADEKGTCYPSYKHIARVIGLETTRTIQNAIKEFEEMGLLRIERRKLDNGGYTSNRYHLTLKSDPIVADNTTPTLTVHLPRCRQGPTILKIILKNILRSLRCSGNTIPEKWVSIKLVLVFVSWIQNSFLW